MVTKDKVYAVKLEAAVLAQLKERHADTYAEHRLDFKGWINRLLIEALDLEEPK